VSNRREGMMSDLVSSHILCPVNALSDRSSREFAVGDGDWPLRGFIVRVGNDVFAYLNRCPHAGHPLNLRPDEFFTADLSLIACRSHGAMFEPTTGRCVAGPCAGQSLRSLPVRLEAGLVILDVNHELMNLA
jgi:nitrite reductase/ring-hydroxylating ferredoxin subunit